MADKLKFELVSPERLLRSDEVDMVTAPGAEGDFGVLAGHAPFITTLRPGVLTVSDAKGGDARYYVEGGFAEVTPAGFTVLAQEAIDVAELDRAALQQRLKDAEEDLRDADSDDKRETAAAKVDHFRHMLAVL